MLITLAAIALAIVIVGSVCLWWWLWRPVVRKRVVVQTGDAAFNGIMLSRRGPLLELGDVTVHTGGRSSKVDGTVVLERRRVDWIQVLKT